MGQGANGMANCCRHRLKAGSSTTCAGKRWLGERKREELKLAESRSRCATSVMDNALRGGLVKASEAPLGFAWSGDGLFKAGSAPAPAGNPMLMGLVAASRAPARSEPAPQASE